MGCFVQSILASVLLRIPPLPFSSLSCSLRSSPWSSSSLPPSSARVLSPSFHSYVYDSYRPFLVRSLPKLFLLQHSLPSSTAAPSMRTSSLPLPLFPPSLPLYPCSLPNTLHPSSLLPCLRPTVQLNVHIACMSVWLAALRIV